jgi:transcriptional antiterminator RfaH
MEPAVWIVAVTKPNSEALAEHHLARQGFTSYCPRFEEKRANKPPRIRPLFPRYIFVIIEHAWYCLRSTRGITSVLLGEDGPAACPESIVSDLRKRHDHRGLVTLNRPPKFAVGSTVKALHGPLVGHALIYQGLAPHDRVHVLMEMLGRKCTVELPECELVAA